MGKIAPRGITKKEAWACWAMLTLGGKSTVALIVLAAVASTMSWRAMVVTILYGMVLDWAATYLGIALVLPFYGLEFPLPRILRPKPLPQLPQ